jgi:hypothetical protein
VIYGVETVLSFRLVPARNGCHSSESWNLHQQGFFNPSLFLIGAFNLAKEQLT